MRKTELLKRFKAFCNGLKKTDRIALLHHSDPDGFCSGLITMKAIKKITGKLPEYISPYEYGNQEQADKLVRVTKRKKLNKLIVVDVGIDGGSNWKEMFVAFEEVLIIDHHKIYQDLNSKKVVFLKAKWFSKKDPAQYACSKLCFDLFNKIVDIKKTDWIASIGIFGDMSFRSWKSFVRKTVRESNFELELLCELLELIAATEVMAEHRMGTLLMEFYNAKSPRTLTKSVFCKYTKGLRKERDRLINGFTEKADYYPEKELFVYEIKTDREGIKSYVINEISTVLPNQTIVVIQDSGNSDLRISGRRQDYKVKINELMEKSVIGIPNSNAGGHIPAAAARIPKKYKAKFKKNLLRIAKKG